MKVTSAREPTETLNEDQDCSSLCIWKEVSCRTNSDMSLPVASVFRNPCTKALTLALGCRANAFSATSMGEPGTKASSLAMISPSLVNAGKTRAPMAKTLLNPSCSVGLASCAKTESVMRKNGSSASAAFFLDAARERRTTRGMACTTASAPTMSAACSIGRRRSESPSNGAGKTRRETTNREYVLGEMNRLAAESIGSSLAWSLPAALGTGQREARRCTSSSGVNLSIAQ
jgi:hypothetical protein